MFEWKLNGYVYEVRYRSAWKHGHHDFIIVLEKTFEFRKKMQNP